MPNNFQIPVCDTFKCMGVVEETFPITIRELLVELGIPVEENQEEIFGNPSIQANEELGLSLEWAGNKEKSLAGFGLSVEKYSEQPKQGHFDPTEETLVKLKARADQKYELTSQTVSRRLARHFGGGFFSMSDTITFKTRLDTDNQRLLSGLSKLEAQFRNTGQTVKWRGDEDPYQIEVRERDGQIVSEIVFPLKLELHRSKSPRYSKFWINVPVRIRSLSPFLGFAAIDFGNSGCTFAIKDESNTSVHNLEIVPVDKENRGTKDPILKSAVYFDNLKSRKDSENPELIDLHPQASWIAGDGALGRPNASRLIVSPKRHLGKSSDSLLNVDDVPMSYHYPAQLLITSVLQEAQFRKKHSFHVRFKGEGTRQSGLTLTYPSTYSDQEISHLRDSYVQAVVRTFQHTITAADVPLPDMVDEASAAAFSFCTETSSSRMEGYRVSPMSIPTVQTFW